MNDLLPDPVPVQAPAHAIAWSGRVASSTTWAS